MYAMLCVAVVICVFVKSLSVDADLSEARHRPETLSMQELD